MYTTLELTDISDDQPITPQTHTEFFHAFQLGVLLTLKERGILTDMQYRSAAESLLNRKCAL